MAIADKFKAQLGGRIAESMGHRSTTVPTPAAPGATPASTPADAGRTRARECGRMEIANIVPDPNQPRTHFDEEGIRSMAASLRDEGQLYPIRVRWNAALGKWMILEGERRYRGALLAGLTSLLCVFVDRELTAREILREQMVENLIREDLQPIDLAHGFQRVMAFENWGVRELAAYLHVSPATISRALALLDLPAAVQRQVNTGELSPSAAYEITKLSTPEEQQEVATVATSQKMKRKTVVEEVRQRRGQTARLKPSVYSFRVSEARVEVRFDRIAAEVEVVAALEEALLQARGPGLRVAA